MLANMCVESHLRELLERGFEVAMVKDATAGPRHPEWGDGYQAAMINYRFLAHAVLSTDEAVAACLRRHSSAYAENSTACWPSCSSPEQGRRERKSCRPAE